ncbi:microtubule-actin cross-linking factor 1, isoforms 1/2/3/4 isoform X2 [Parasteatoda tepidariorum]|uniref:microtubule-actin cross-linking factor 1, isoforms 1/2/3/4 isoform X2 n=1 Tax=Parasteatoda tepidariorum TaxID=114398 RepID=UPI001C724451|nr:microtubule-actin cross-linking factor 1 isoform X2 [Parasteatoda tepidariorum]
MEYCVWGWYGVVHDAHSFQASLSEWMKDKPLSILQLDPADRAVLRIADERDAIQKKTFTKWVNKHLKKANREIFDLFDDLRDGLNLISLLEVLSSEKLPREKGVLRFHKLQNVQIALDFLRYRKIKLVNIRAEDIVDGNPKLTLGLIWTIILHFQISDIITHQTDERISAKEALLRWAQRTTDRYPGVRVGDFTKSWRDGLAFNAIIHRNRPDLVDYRSCLKRTARDNLDSAFTIAERELNVTKLLDPEDVDTPEPDEKSLITYISSLYDVFPRPPSHNPFAADDEKSRKVEEYKDLSSSLFLWMRESLSSLQDRNFPNTLVEMKSLLADCTRFRVEEVPPRLHEKQRLSHLFREIQKMHVEVSEELRYETLERLWNKVMAAHQERDQAIHDEIARLEKLQRLAEKVHRETKQCDGKMDDIERHIAEEEKRVQRLHPNDVKYNCDQIDAELKHVEDSLKSMSRDVQTLRDGRYHQALELHKRVQQLHERFLTLRMHFQTRLLNVLATRSLKAEEKKVSKPKPLSLEKLIETNKHFKFLQECIDWVHNKLKYLEEADYGTDLQSVQILLEQHHTEHRLIDQFQKNVDQCSSQKSQFRGEELELYCKLLSKLEKGYSEVLVLSNKRMSDLDTLLDFIQSATNELIWMNEKEEIEINRDWSSKTLNIPEIEDYQRALTIELEKREVQFNSVQDRGESLVLQKHPASKCIEAYLAAMQTQWSWLLQLMSCLDVHLKYAFIYHQFFDDAKECQQWLKQIENRLSTTYSRQNFSIDEGERLMKEMQDLRDELSHYSNVVSSLIERSKDIAPLKQRRQPLPRPLRITAVCSFKQQSMTVSKDEQCWLHDNSNRTKWKIINSLGMEGMVPSVCFVIPPPNPEALELAESLKKQFEAIVNLWTSKQRKLRQNMIFATIKIIKSWDITKFRSIEPLQRESIIKALNEDTQKLLNEGSSDDPALKRLQEEIAYCNKLFADLQRMLDQDEVDKQNKSQARKFNDLCASVQSTLTDKERILKQKTQAPIPRSKEIVNRLVQEQQDFESDLHAFEPRVDEVREAFRELSVKTAALQSRHDSVIESWNNLWSISSLYVERMKAVELTLSHYDDASQATSHAELQLISLDEVPNDTESAARVEENLRTLKIEMQLKQVLFEQVSQSVVNVRHFVELSRPNQSVHTDVTKLEEDVKKVRRRWDLAGTQVNDRLKALETSMELLQSYKGKYNEQKAFVSQMSTKVESMKAVSRMDSREMHHAIESTTSTYHTLSQRKAAIEDVNVDGGRYLREAKMYELLLKQYQESIEDNPADSNAKKAKLISETEIISQELDELNKEYTDLVNSVLQRLNELKSLVSSQEGQKFSVPTIIQATPITLKTYRTELILEQVPFYHISNHTQFNTPFSDLSNSTHQRINHIPNGTASIDINMDDSHPLTHLSGTTLSFEEVKCSRRSSISNSLLSTIFEEKTILDPFTKEKISFNEAIVKNIINVSTLKYYFLKTEYTFEEAVAKAFIDKYFFDTIHQYYGVCDRKMELTVLGAIQRKFINTNTGSFHDPKIQSDISIEKAVEMGLVKGDKVLFLITNNIISCTRYTISEAVIKGYLDPDSGLFVSPHTGKILSIPEAYTIGHLYTAAPIIEDTLSLSECLSKDLITQEGKVIDPDSGHLYLMDEALIHGILSKRLREIVDPSIGSIVCLPEAINDKLINPATGSYVHPQTNKILSLKEAKKFNLIIPSMTLKHAFECGIIDKDGNVTNILNSSKISLIRAAVIGIISFDIKCIVCPNEDKVLTLAEALVSGLITPDCKFIDEKSNEILNISQAANRGYLASVDRRMVFDIEGFRDTKTSEYISFNDAVSRKIIDNGKIFDMNTSNILTMAEGINHKLVIPEVYEMLIKPIGIYDNSGEELNVLDCVGRGLLDPLTGYLLDPFSKRPLRLMEAVEQNIITEDGAVMLKSLLNITVTLTSITKTTTKYVTVATHSIGADLRMTFDEAYQRGLIDERGHTFEDPVTGSVMKIEEAISKGFLSILPTSSIPPQGHIQQSEVTVFRNNAQFTSLNVGNNSNLEISLNSKLSESDLENNTSKNHSFFEDNTMHEKSSNLSAYDPKGLFQTPNDLENCHVYTKSVTEHLNSSKMEISNTLPNCKYKLKQLVDGGVFDLDTGYLNFEKKLKFTLEESVIQGLIGPDSALVNDYSTNKMINLADAFDKKVITTIGSYVINNKIISMREAVEKNLIIFVDSNDNCNEHDLSEKSILFNKIYSNARMATADVGINVGEEIQKREFSNLSNKINFSSAMECVDQNFSAHSDCLKQKKTEVEKTIIPVGTSEFITNFDLKNVSEFSYESGVTAHELLGHTLETPVIINSVEVVTEEPMDLDSEQIKSEIQSKDIEHSKDEKIADKDECTDESNSKKSLKAQYSVPRFEVTIGRALLDDPAKAVVLKKVKKKKVSPKDAADKGVTDKETADKLRVVESLFGADGKSLSLEEAVKLSYINGNDGTIKDPRNNETLTINQAIDSGILDPETGQFNLPVGRSLSIPEAVNQGLVEPTQQKIVHPEHGEHLSIQEAIVCEIINPMSELKEPSTGKNVTLENAIEIGIVDGSNGEVQTFDGKLSMLDAVKREIFELSNPVQINLPPLAASFPVALRQGFIDLRAKTYQHPISGQIVSILEAINLGLIMTSGSKADDDHAIYLFSALENNLIDPDHFTLVHPITGKAISIEEAVNSGLLFISSELPKHSLFIPKSGEIYVLNDLVSNKNFNVEIYTIFNGNIEIPLSTAFSQNLLQLDGVVEILDERRMSVLLESIKDSFSLSPLNYANAVSSGFYDNRHNVFLDISSKTGISFIEAIKQYDAFKQCMFKNPNTMSFVSLEDAIFLSLIDKITGKWFDTVQQMTFSCFEGSEKGVIIYIPNLENKCLEDIKPLTMQDIIVNKMLNLEDLKLKLPGVNQLISLNLAVERGIVKPTSILVYNPKLNKLMPLNEAQEKGLTDCENDIFIHPVTSQEVSWKDAFKRGFIVPLRKPISLEAAIRHGFIVLDSGLITDPITKLDDNIEMAVRKGIIDGNISLICDTKIDKFVSLEDALLKRLVSKSGKVRNTLENNWLNFTDALNQGLIRTKHLQISLIEAIEHDLYNPCTGRILNPMSGCDMTLKEALALEYIESNTIKIKDPKTRIYISLKDAISQGILNDTLGTYSHIISINLLQALDSGFIINCNFPLSLPETLEHDMYDVDSGQFRLPNGDTLCLQEMIDKDLVNANVNTIFETHSNTIVPLCDAHRNVDAVKNCVITDHAQLNFLDAYDIGLILPFKRKLTLSEAVTKIFYDSESCIFFDPFSQTERSLKESFERNIIDVSTTIFCDKFNQRAYSFQAAVKQNYIDPIHGRVITDSSHSMSFQEAFNKKILVEINYLSLTEAITTNIYQKNVNRFINPFDGKQMTLAEAIELKFIDHCSTVVKGINSPQMDLDEAIERNIVDAQNSFVNLPNKLCITLDEALELGYLNDRNPCLTLQHAISNGLYDNKTGKFSINSKVKTLRDCLKLHIIEGTLPCYWEEISNKVLSLDETIVKGLINGITGRFFDPITSIGMPLDEALLNGYLINTEKPLTLYDALKFNMITEQGKFVSPKNGITMSLRNSCKSELISPKLSLVKTNKDELLSLDKAIDLQIIDDIAGTYTFKNEGIVITLNDAFKQNLIVPFTKPLDFVDALKMDLFDIESGTFIDPLCNSNLNIQEALDSHLIKDDVAVYDSSSNTLKSLQLAISDCTIDLNSGKLRNSQGIYCINLHQAIEERLLVIMEPGFISKSRLRSSPLSTNFACTLQETLNKDFIDSKNTYIKDPENIEWLSIDQAVHKGVLNLRQKVIFCHISKQTDLLVVKYDNRQMFCEKPFSFKEALQLNHLNLFSGMYKNPSSNQIFTLKESIELGYIDSSSAIVKDTKNKAFLSLQSAFENNTLDANKGMVIDSNTNQVLTLKGALDQGMIRACPFTFSLLEALQYGLFDEKSGLISNPFSDKPETLMSAISSGLIDPSSTLIKEPASCHFYDISSAISKGIISPNNGSLLDLGGSTSLMDAYRQGLLVPSEKRVAIEEKFRLYVDNSSKLLSWLQEKELEMADLGLVREDADDLYRQINTAKTIRQELEDNQRTVMSCIDQAQQLIEQGQDVLSKDEIHTVQKNSEVLKKRYYRASDESEKLLRRLNTALEELRKFSNELINFMEWLKESHLKQSEKEKNLVDLEHLKENADSYKAFSSDVIAHQADLRFITIAAQKFVDESKDYLKVLNNFRTNLPQRLAHLEPGESEVKIKVQEVSTAYQNLLNRIDRLGDKFGILYNKQRNFEECMEKATAWLNSVTKTTKKVIDEPVAADPRAIQDQLDRVKALNMELIQQARLIDAAKQAGNSLLDAFDEADISPSEKRNIENKIKRMEDEYNNICNAVNGRSNELQMALLHSQDIQDGLDRLLKWLDDAESNLRNQNRPVSLIKEKLEEQIQAHRVLLSDIDGQKPTFDAVNDSARELLNSSNQRLAKKIESKLKEVNLRFEKLCEKAQKRSELLEDICKSVGIFEIGAKRMEEWLTAMLELIQKKDSSDLSITEDVMNQKEVRREEFEEVLRSGKTLVSKRDITDTSVVKERMRALEQQWKELGDFVSEQHRKNKEKMEQLSAYEALRAKILEWLTSMEFKVDALEPVALDKEVLRRQSLEIKTLSKEYADYSTTIDKVNDLGNSYDAMLKGESPRHYSGSPRKSASPTRMSPPKHRRSPDYGSPSGRGIQSPLSSISSGFGSSRSSADNLGGIEDLTPIQQQLAEINHRYSLIGIKLSDRSQEINSFSDEVKVYLDSLKNLLSFVQSKERQMPKEPMPVHRDQAAKQLQALKAIQDDMLERQLEFDRLKSQTEDLARRKPTTPGIDNLQMQMSDLAQRWNELLATLKDKTSFLQDLKDFQDSQEAMNTWLGQKEKMFQVLGPIASDPRMVTSQIQQVQVLRDEFTSQEPILNKSRECGHAILDHLDVNSPAAKKIREQLQNTNLRWDDLMNKLTDREQNLAAASGAAKEFQDSLNRLQDRLQHISDDFDHLSEAGTDAVDQLRKLNDLEEQLEDQRPLLAGAEAVCEQLCDVLSDPASKSEIKNKLNGVEKQYNNLNRKMNNRKAELESALKEDKDFYLSFDRIQQWLNDMEDTLSHEFLVSADQDILKRQAQEFESVYKQVLSKDHEVHLLMSKGADMLQKVTRKVDAAQLQNKMDSTKRQWEKVRKIANDRHTLLQKCSENCKKYHNSCNSFVPWLNKCEDKVQSLQPISFQKTQLDKQVKEIQGIKNDLIKHSQEFENTCNFGEVLISCCDIDVENVRDDTDRLRKRWDRLNHDVLERAQALDDISHKLNVYQDKARDVNHSLHRLEDRLLSHDALGDSSKDPKLLARMKALLNEAGDVKRQLNGLRDYVDILVSEASPSVDTSHITNEVEDLENRHRILTQKLEDRCCDLESASEVIAQFNNKMKDAHLDLNHLEEELDNMSPIARDVKTLNAQINQIKNYLHRLKRARDDFEDVEHQCNDIITHGYTPDPKGCRNQLDSLQRQLIRLEERAKTRDNNLDAMLTRLERFYEDYTHISRDLEDTIHEERSFKSVGGEVDAIRSQQEEFKHYHKDRLEPLGKQIDGINKVGQGLIQSASSGVDTSILEQDLDSLNEKWNNLKQKMNERERKLDIAFLQSGKFQDALDGVQKWLEDTEEMVANQKPPSADYKVVKAQLQEQKFLNKLLFDRQNSMSSLMQMGSEIMKNAEPMERMQIESQLNDLMHRFDELSNSAQERTDALERTIPVAKEFQDRIIPLEEWLEQTEKKLAAMATIPTDQEKIRKRMIEHEALHDDIMDHKAAFEELTEVAQTLMSLVGDDEAQMVVEKLQDATNHFAKVVEDSEHIGQLLAEAFQGLGSFNMNYEDLMAWIDEMASRFSRFRTLSVYVDKLQEQLDELVELSEEIADHQKQVDEVANAGQEIMKHASGDDVIRMKEKLDNLSVKFTDLTSRAADKLRQAQDALPLVQNYHASHERVIVWMEDTERQLKNLENVGLSSQETIIQRLEGEIQEYRPLVETLNHLGPQLCQMSPGQGAADIENQVTRINRRFDAICEQVQRKAERIDLSKQRNVEVISDIEDLLDWFHDVEKQLLQAEPLTANPDSLAVLLKEQKVLNDEVSSQKGRVRDILSSAKKLMRESSGNDLAEVRNKADELKEVANSVSAMCADRLAVLEQALPLAEHFFETHADLCQWLDEIESEAELMETPAMNAHQIKKQQDRNKALMQSVHEHKPLVDKLNKTGAALKKLCIPKEAHKVQNIMDSDNSRYNALKDILRDRQNALEEAMQATSQFSDKLDGMLNSLSNTAEQLQNAEPVAAHVEKLEEQLNDNQAVLQDLDKRSNALEAVKRAADDVIVKAGGARDPAVKDIKQKLDKLNQLWDNIQKLASNRNRSLEDALAAAERFWDELTMVMKALKELQDSLNAQEPPAVEPSAIQHQQDALEEIKQEIEQTKPEVEQCRQAGQDLMQLCGEPDKPEVKKHIEDLDSAWENVTSLYAKREQNLVDAMEKAMNFHDILGNILEFLDSAEESFAALGPVGSDIEAVKGQIQQLQEFKQEVDPHMVEIESLNRQAHELMERTSPTQAKAIREPLAEINRRWDDLLKGIVNRQRELENALLRLGQFQHALDEFMAWMSKTEKTLDDLTPVFGDPQVIEVELAKHKVLMNDIQAHQTSVDTLNSAGRQLIEANRGSEDASVTQSKLNKLNKRWQFLQDKAAQRQRELEEALHEAQIFNQEIQDLLMWLSDIDSQLVSSKPVGGLPETAREQLNRFMELYNDLDNNKHKIDSVMQQGQDYLKRSNEGAAGNLQHNLKTLKQRWENVLNRANDRKIKLEIALREATEFHGALQDFVEWLTNAEKFLTSLKPVSRVMDVVLEQIEDHKAFQKEVSAHREVMLNLDKKGTHLKYFSQKQDVILIKNLLISVQHRWERVVSKAAERTRALDHGYKEAKEFHDAWSDLSHWLDDAEKQLDVLTHVGNDPEKIKQMLAKHKEFQRTLGSKQPYFDGTMKLGRNLKEKCPKVDVPVLQDMMDDLKNKWNNVCAKSVDKQRKLEEALLFSGQFKDAVQALIDWLEKAKKTLSENQLLHGDLDTVMALVDQHKSFQDELKSRANNLESVRRTARELLETASEEDANHIREQLSQLDQMWIDVANLAEEKQRKLDEALHEAERLHKAVHMLLEWLSDAEMKLRYSGPLPDDEETTKQQIADHENFMREMIEQEVNKDTTIAHAQEILKKCHPDGVSVIRHWITIIQSRWEEVSLWAKQREQRLNDHLRSLRDILDLLEELLNWLISAENTLTTLEAEPLPDEIPVLEQLIADHQVFMDDMTKRQPDVERVTKAFQSKRQPPQQQQSHPGKDKGRERHESAHDRKSGRSTPSIPKTPANRQGFEPEIKNPRARELVDRWRNVWLLAMERQRRLQDKLNYLKELERIKNFDFDEWRKKFLAWMNNKKSRVMDLFRKIDKDNDGKVTQEEFIEGILKSKFPTSRLEMERVAEIFDRNGDGFIDHKEYIDTLRPDREKGPLTEAEKIQDEVQRQVAECTCAQRFKVYQVGEGKYRFGESQKLRLVRILRSTVMVRVGGGWVALDEFLVKNDPCRAKGRTNLELREQFILAEGVSQSLQPFKPKASPNSSQSSQSASFNRLPATGPITKVREKSERSVPMSKQRSNDSASDFSYSDADSSFGSKSAKSRTPNRLTPGGFSTRNGKPSSRPSSRPPSRAASDLSANDVDSYRARKMGSSGARQRTPSASSQTSGRGSGTKIPTVRRTPSFTNSSSKTEPVRRERERWK